MSKALNVKGAAAVAGSAHGSASVWVFDEARGWAALAEHIDRELREARRSKAMAIQAGHAYRMSVEYWTGNIVALVNLKKAFKRELKARPNE